MPGLAIIVSPAKADTNREDLNRMIGSMRHEPFYTSGTYCDESLGLYVGWVCHPNSYSDCMPLTSACGNLLVFFYGEHRNDEPTSSENNARVVLRLFEKHGLNALPMLNGWFHGIIVDRRRHEISVFNDRYGMQRLHHVSRGGTALFAAEAKALLAARPDLRELNPRSVAEFLSCGCVLENRSLFSDIHTLPAASVRVFNGAVPGQSYSYFKADQWETQSQMTEAEYRAALLESFPRALSRCMNGDLPIGISLTGGYDTRLMMAWLSLATTARLPSYTFGGMYRDCFDVTIARKVASICAISHQVLELGGDFLKSFPALAKKTVLLSEGCLGATNAYELYLNQCARQIAPVRLTGSYGSEVMRGARAFKTGSLTAGLAHPDFQRHLDTAAQSFAAVNNGHSISFSVFKQAPWFYYNRLAVEQSQVIVRTPYMDNDFVGLVYRRPIGLTNGRGLAKYLITQGAPSLATLPTDTGNCSFVRQLWSQFLFKADYCYKSGMPQWLEQVHHLAGPLQPEKLLIGRHRFAHFRVWFRNQLAPYLRDVLLDRRTAGRPYFNHGKLERMLTQHISGNRNYTDDIERALTVELTCRQFVDA